MEMSSCILNVSKVQERKVAGVLSPPSDLHCIKRGENLFSATILNKTTFPAFSLSRDVEASIRSWFDNEHRLQKEESFS